MVRFLVLGDVHGITPKVHFSDFDAIILPGDICSDEEIRPLEQEWMIYTQGIISFNDYVQAEYGESLDDVYERSLQVGRKILLSLAKKWKKPIFFTPGNWDQSYGATRIKNTESAYGHQKMFLDFYLGSRSNKELVRDVPYVFDCQYECYQFLGVNILGYGLSSGPEKVSVKESREEMTKKEVSQLVAAEKKITKKLNNAYKKRDKSLVTVFVSHNVPFETNIDVIDNPDSPVDGMHLGSTIAREFCEKKKPLLCIGGHMHEHFGCDMLASTTVLNAGFGAKVNALIDIDEKKKVIRSIDFFPDVYGNGKSFKAASLKKTKKKSRDK